MKRAISLAFGSTAFLLLTLVGTAAPDPVYQDEKPAKEQEPAPKNRNRWMQAKRNHAQQIFSALTDGDFEQMELSGRRMLVAGVIEKWFAENPLKDDVEYREQLKAFDKATRDFVREAEDKDLEEAFEAYTRMSRSCIKCHQLMRSTE
ncbi:MAG: hypothetical protein JNL58_28070 [Planctomyces sp.]|nr:hypothetical protein [Planctomyces sp.]